MLTLTRQSSPSCLLQLIHADSLMQSGLHSLEDIRDEADRAAAFINREIDGDVSSSAAGSRGEGKKEEEEKDETWLASRRSVSMTSNMLIESLHSYIATLLCQKSLLVKERSHGTVWHMCVWVDSSLRGLKNARIRQVRLFPLPFLF